MLNLVDDGVIEWNEPEVVKALRGALKHGLRTPNRQQRNGSPLKPHEIAPSARLTRSERLQITRIRVDLAQNGIRPQRWELEALACGATVNYDGKNSRIRSLMSGRDSPTLWRSVVNITENLRFLLVVNKGNSVLYIWGYVININRQFILTVYIFLCLV